MDKQGRTVGSLVTSTPAWMLVAWMRDLGDRSKTCLLSWRSYDRSTHKLTCRDLGQNVKNALGLTPNAHFAHSSINKRPPRMAQGPLQFGSDSVRSVQMAKHDVKTLAAWNRMPRLFETLSCVWFFFRADHIMLRIFNVIRHRIVWRN